MSDLACVGGPQQNWGEHYFLKPVQGEQSWCEFSQKEP